MIISAVATLPLLSLLAAGPAPLTITPAVTPVTSAPAVRWVTSDDASWKEGAPTFHLADDKVTAAVDGWIATTSDRLLVHLVVSDEQHIGRPGDLLWEGDFVRIAVDGRGDGTMGAAIDTPGPFGPDDVTLGLAFTPEGSLALVFGSGAGTRGKLPAETAVVARDEATHKTSYDLRLPWSQLNVMPGALPTFGIAVQVKDMDPGKSEAFLRFGEGASDLRAGRFKTLAFANPPRPYVGATLVNAEVWTPATDAGEIAVVVAGGASARVQARGDGASANRTIKSDTAAPQRFRVRYAPPASAPSPAVGVEIQAAGLPAVKLRQALVLPERLFTDLYARLDALMATAPHPLFLRHLRSVRALAQTERARLDAYRDNPAKVRETVTQVAALLAGFNADAAQWEAYLDGRRSLLMAFVSKRDATLQSYYVTLPKGWDPKKSRDEQAVYPLLVELHGAGNPHPLVWVASELGGNVKAKDLLGYESAKSFASQQRAGYHVQPFGRGNSGYRDIGEVDVWEAIADAESLFRTDPDRHYLFGFSMGGAGTWAIGSRTPDQWAAIAIYGASPNPGAALGLPRNLTNTPVWHWNGEEDHFAAAGQKAFNGELQRLGVPLTWSSTPKLGHAYIAEKQKEGVLWLEQHTRKRPASFSFVADTQEHRGVWGITMDRDVALSGAPRFECSIKGNTVTLTSQGTPALDVKLGEGGLGLAGAVTVNWNGKPAYAGPAVTIRLPAGAPAASSGPRRAAAGPGVKLRPGLAVVP